MNKKKILKTIMSLLIVITLTPQVAFAHKGRTDSSGGHRDNKNVSGLGYYHYHCGGHPAHLHANGVCPYGNNSSSSSTSSNDNDVSKRNEAQKNGYDAGYQAGSNGDTYNDSSSLTYANEYKSGYSSGYEKGKEELEIKIKTAYDEGFALGSKGENENNTYDVQAIKSSYSKGYDNGLKAYINENKEKYFKFGEEDAVNFTMREFDSNVPNELKEEYKKSYSNKTSNLKKIAYDLGYEKAVNNKEADSSNFKHSEEKNSYDEGYNEGKADIEKEKDIAYEYGHTGKEYDIPEQLAGVEELLLSSYNEGVEKLKLEKESQDRAIKTTMAVLLVGGIAGGAVIKKKKGDSKNLNIHSNNDNHKEGF